MTTDPTKTERPVRVRIGPSPTGEPHVGTAYIALFNLAFTRKNGGKFVLRIEDTDQERSKPEWERQIMQGLRWLGLEWDEGPDKGGPYGPYRQSERQEIHRRHAFELIDRGGAYRCFCTKERLDELREEQKKLKVAQGYDRHCRDLSQQEIDRQLAAGTPFVIRMKMPLDGKTIIKDRLRGEVEVENAQIDDQVLLKADGFPTYHLANVVDDHLMEITHVIRAEEWLVSTPKHIVLYASFGWQAPEWIHMPLLRNADKSKISKRKNPVSILDYRQRGFVPAAVLNYLAMMGWSMPDGRDVFSFDEFVENFTFDRISLGGPVFDLEKLTWLNGKYYRERMSDDELTELFRNELFSKDYLRQIVPLIRERIDKAEDFIPATEYFFRGDVPLVAAELKPKGKDWKDVHAVLEAFMTEVETRVDFSAPSLEQLGREFAEKHGWKPKDLFMPLRVGITGRSATPPLFETMSVLGRALVRRRLRAVVELAKREASEEAKAKQKAESDAAKAKKAAEAEAAKAAAAAKKPDGE
ncbi:glutamate--tRNA ligase [Myxococcota bacterium]|nr:glutamate--tRNA ligase [Myxococcota bacterium]